MTRLLFNFFAVLMLDNWSFDHPFGYLGIGDKIPRGGATNYLKMNDNSSEKFVSHAPSIVQIPI